MQQRNKILENDQYTIINLDDGKTYIDSEKVEQKGQKGATCWYYVFSQRIKIGKKVEKKLKMSQSTDQVSEEVKTAINALLAKREQEKIISNYKKEILKIEPSAYNSFREILIRILTGVYKKENITTITKDEAKLAIEFFTSMNNKQFDPAIAERIEFLNKFIQSKRKSLLEFYENEILESKINATRHALKLLNRESKLDEVALREYKCETALIKDPASLLGLCYQTMTEVIAETFGFVHSKFNPLDDFYSFSNIIKKEGPLICAGFFGGSYYTSLCTQEEKKITLPTLPSSIKYDIYFWKSGTAKKIDLDDDYNSHYVMIVGTQILKSKAGLQETVLFVDPKDAVKPGEPRKVYRMSYSSFKEKLLNIRTNIETFGSKNAQNNIGPFAYCLDEKLAEESKAQFELVSNKLGKS